MKIGMVGLGKMGANMAQRLIQGGHQVIVIPFPSTKPEYVELFG